ncbi:MAG TPA: type II toxin-antitoxin system HicA family toxin [Candidatus Acidoferrum sp.]|nr:type II toxin-antitoxin system HicA family toxin [Candidatus Acidoferrum sp.]
MSPRVPILKPREVLRALQKAGFVIHHHSGSHAQLKHPDKPQLRVTVPRHDRFDLPMPLLRSIIRQAGMTVKEFLKFL